MWYKSIRGRIMELKNKIVKTAKVCYIAAKVLYLIAFAVCLAFIGLAIGLSVTNAISALSPAETAVLFSTLALYAFVCIGLLWNVEGLFKTIAKEQSPFTERVSHYLKKVAIFVIVLSAVPALLGTTILRIVCPETEVVFPIELCGIVVGAVLFFIGLLFKYGKELQKRDDETL